MTVYGFQRLALLNSAGYQRAELPLDDAVSLIAPNNTGKTSLINALQFLLIIHKGRMDFGAHGLEVSRRFYFPSNSSYILLELALPNGTVVVGCVGKGVSHDYSYFAYKGTLELDDYRTENGALVQEPQLVSHMAARQNNVFRYAQHEFEDGLYGSRRARKDHEPDFAAFKLDSPRQAAIFQRVLTRTLRLDKLRSDEVKGYLLDIFRQDMPDHAIDFKAEWDQAFAEVNAERAQYDAAFRQKGVIERLENLRNERFERRGKILHDRPLIDVRLLEWQSYFEAESQNHAHMLAQLRQQQSQFNLRQQQLIEERLKTQQHIKKLEDLRRHHASLQQALALLSRAMLEARLSEARQQLEAQIALVQQASARGKPAILNDLRTLRREMEGIQRQLATLADNFYLALKRHLPEVSVDKLNRLLNGQLMSLAGERFELDAQALQLWLEEHAAVNHITLPGLNLPLDGVEPQHQQKTAEELRLRLDELSQQEKMLQQQLVAAEEMAMAMQHKVELEQAVRGIEHDLARFDELMQLEASAEERQREEAALGEKLTLMEQALQALRDEHERVRDEERKVDDALAALKRQHGDIARLKDARGDDAAMFQSLIDLPHQAWLGRGDVPLAELAKHLENYREDCRRLLRLDEQIHGLLAELHAGGLTKFQYSQGDEQEIERMIEFGAHLPQELAALERKARAAVVNVAVSLRFLRDGLRTLRSRMNEFNRLVSKRRVSDLSVFRIDPIEEQALVEAMELLIATAEQADHGETFDLFNHASMLDDEKLNRAKHMLIQEGNARGALKVEHFFRLVFVIGKAGHAPESFADIDSAASNGTVLMAKLVTGLALLYLMQDKRHAVQAVCYLDEAAALDQPNQRSLIEAAREFGFALIFASPQPLLTARYCVPITAQGGRNYINRHSWQMIEPLA